MKRDAYKKLLSGKHYNFIVFVVLMLSLFNTSSLVFVSAGSNQSNISFSLEFESPCLFDVTINKSVFTYISMDNCVSFAKKGDPVLPVYPARILVPYGKKIVDIKIVNQPFIKLKDDLLGKPIAPQQEAFPFSKKIDDDAFLLNETVYNSCKPVFDSVYSYGDYGLCRGYTIFTVFLYPVQYIPKSGLIYYTPQISMDVILEDSSDTFSNDNRVFYRQSSQDDQILSTIVENPEDVQTYSNFKINSENSSYENGICGPVENYDYVIITSESLSDTSGYEYNLSDLVSHRISYSGLNATIVTVEEIDSCQSYWNQTSIFNDTQAHIREFCKDAYQDWETQYILLAGDWDLNPSHQIVPFRLFTDYYELGTYDSMACDMYYSHLDGDWYYSDEEIWGGGIGSGANDFYGELFLGRIAVSNAEHISNAVSKIIDYDVNKSLSTDWLRSASFWGGELGFPNVNSKEYMEELRLGIDTYRNFTGFEEFNANHSSQELDTFERLYHEDLDSDYTNYFTNSLINDNASIINHLDHASWSEIFSLNNWDGIKNSKPFFGYSQGCLSGRFHNFNTGDSGCEMLICENPDKHAYSLVLNTGYGYGSGSSTNGASQYLQSYFWDYFFDIQSDNVENWFIGKAMAYSQDKIAAVINSHSHAWCYAWYSSHLFGDPAQKIRINCSNTPPSLDDYNPEDDSSNLALSLSNISINISDFDSDLVNWSIQTFPNVGNSSEIYDTGGIKKCNISNLSYETEYIWFVNVTDGIDWTNESFSFTTRSLHTPESPSSFEFNASRFDIQLSWINDEKADFTLIEWSTKEDNNWSINDHSVLYNGSNETFTQQNLTPGSAVYYKAWSYNNSDDIWSNPVTINTTTNYNNAPILLLPNPENNSLVQNLSLNWSIDIQDLENDSFNYSIETSNNQSINETNSNNGTKIIIITNLSYSTNYKIWVNASDNYNSTSKWYNITTISPAINNAAPLLINPIPDNTTNNVEITLLRLTILINDSEGNNFNWTVETSPFIGNNFGNNDSNGTKHCNVSSLSYSTNYTWFVNVTDGINCTNKTYYFTTNSAPETPPMRPPSGGGYVPAASPTIKNNPPVADAGGPYNGSVNQSMIFIGSNSSDDEKIKSYMWDFGDGAICYHEKTNHTYAKVGNYTVKLMVTDNKDESSIDVTYANIIQEETDKNEINPYNSDDMIISKIDSDNDKIPDEIEKQIGSDYESAEGVIILKIDDITYCLLDSGVDGEIDFVYNTKTEEMIDFIVDDGIVLIDVNEDYTWDYYYELETQNYAEYKTLLKNQDDQSSYLPIKNMLLIVIMGLIILLLLIYYMFFLRSKSNEHEINITKQDFSGYLKNYNIKNGLQTNAVNFFSKKDETTVLHKETSFQKDVFSNKDLNDYYNTVSNLQRYIKFNQKNSYNAFIMDKYVDNFKNQNKLNYPVIRYDKIKEKIDYVIDKKLKEK